jgi:hypothetical protein
VSRRVCKLGGGVVGGIGNWYRYLIAQHACLEALPILPTLWSEERANACVKVTEGFIFVC